MGKKLLLNLKYKPDFKIVGIFSPVKDYRLCWLLNSHLGFSFNFYGNFPVLIPPADKPGLHNVFEHNNEMLFLRMFVLCNKNNEQIIFPKPANIDYLLLFQADEVRFDINELITSIRSVPHINAAYLLGDKLGKRADEIFYDMELFITEVDNAKKRI